MTEAKVFIYFLNGVFEKRQKAKGTCMQGGITLIYFQCLITNLLQLISLLCPQLLFFCHQFIFLWKSERHQGSPESHQEQNRCPRCLITGLVCRPILLFMSCIQIIYFVQTLFCFEKDFRTPDCFYHSTVCLAQSRDQRGFINITTSQSSRGRPWFVNSETC